MIYEHAASWLSVRVRLLCLAVLMAGSLMPPYVPRQKIIIPEIYNTEQQFLMVEDGFLMKLSPLTSRKTRITFGEGVEHVVKEGEGLEKIAKRYNISADTIRWANNLPEGNVIHPGDKLIILPVDGVLHTVSLGQTLSDLAELYSVEKETIIRQNNLKSPLLLANQELIIPGAKPIVTRIAQVQPPSPGPAGPSAPADSAGLKSADIANKPEITSVPAPKAAAPGQTVSAGIDSGTTLHKPCSAACFITQYYHRGHYAIDMQEKGGGPIFAAETGTVIRAENGWNGGFGNVIEIDHGNGLVTLYAHNKSLLVKKGDIVYRGQQIAWMGNTGLVYGPTGIHIHFEVQVNGIKKNPLIYLE